MTNDLTDAILIMPEAIPEYLRGEGHAGSGVFVVRCEEVDVCKYEDGRLTHVACDHPRHGSHPKYRERYERIHDLMSRLKMSGAVDDGPCPKCDGVGWHKIGSAAANQQVLMSLTIGIWRGIPYGTTPLNIDDAGGMIKAFLSAIKAEEASSSPAGVAAPGRAIYPEVAQAAGAEIETGKGKERNDDGRSEG